MKGIGVTLALLFLTGTQARHFWQQDEPPPDPMEHLKEQWQKFLDATRESASKLVAQLDASSLSQHLNMDLATKAEMMAAVVGQVQEHMAPGYQAIKERLHADYRDLTTDLEPIRAKIKPMMDDLHTKLYEEGQAYYAKLKPLVQEWRQSVHQDMEVLQSKVEPVAAEARDKVRVLVADFRQKANPYLEEMRQAVRQKLELAKERAGTRLQEFHAILQEQLSNLREAAAPLVQGIRERIGPALKDLQDRMVTWMTAMQKHLEQQQQQS
uniref:apolipoprotein A-I n=1 Tax=Euleptes europaea TaxID=460621 RepID=UPI00253FCB20|nr:apolipoprotein A-I [Euleptes europaea]